MTSNALLLAIGGAIVLSMVIVLINAITAKRVFNLILSANCFASYSVVLISIIASFSGQTSYVDIALIYAIINFIATIGFLKYFTHRTLS